MPSALETIIGAAESAVGVPYRWGGNSLAAGVDCSGLVQQAFLAAGIRLPRVSASQMRVGQQVGSINEAQPGDLLGWDTGPRNQGADHIAIYIGNGLMIEAYRTGEPVRVTQVRGNPAIRRVIGNIDAGTPAPVQLGPNQDRKFTAAALGVPASAGSAQDQPEVVAAQTVTAPPEGGLGDDLPENATEEETQDYIRKHLPQYAAWLDNDEIRYVLTWAVREDKDAHEIQGALQRTNYFQTHGPESRAFDTILGTDMARATQLIDRSKGILSDLFARNGISLDDTTLGELAKQAIRAGNISLEGDVRRPDALNAMVAFSLGTNPDELPAGDTAFNADQLDAIARREFLLPLTQREANEWAIKMTNGQATEEQFRSEMSRRAQERYQWLGLSPGQSTASRFDGAVAEVSRLLEVDEDSIDLLDPQWNWIVEKTNADGTRYSPTLGEVAQGAREQALRRPYAERPAWAKQADSDITVNLARWAGKVA